MISLEEKYISDIEDTENNIKYFDIQLSMLNSLKKNSPEVEKAFNGETFEDLIIKNRNSKTKYMTILKTLQYEYSMLSA